MKSPASMEGRVQALLDREEIRGLRTRYAHYLDGNRPELLGEIFTASAIVEVTVGKMHGLAEIQSGLAKAYADFDRDGRAHYPFMHAIVNHDVVLTGPDTAEGQCYLIDFETASKPDPNPLLLLGLYKDEYQRIDGAWRISFSRLETVWDTASRIHLMDAA